jgi:acetyl-CoA C-acetyltransferase
MTVADNTPILIGVGEASERIDAADYAALSPVALASKAAAAAIADAGGSGLAEAIDLIASIRQFEISGPGAVPPFGASNNFPRSVAKRIGANPRRAVLEVVGGQGPQHLVTEMSHAIASGEIDMALLCGSEAISTVRHLQTRGESRDWSETVDGDLEDRGYGMDSLRTPELAKHGARTAINLYAFCENARRGRLGLNRDDYRHEMAKLFAPFTQVAAQNPHAMSRDVQSVDDLATITASNRLTSDPFPRRMVARDQANQGAALLLTSVGKARALGVPEDRWLYLHGAADAAERNLLDRADIGASPAAVMADKGALDRAGKRAADMDFIDFYSCFPIAVFNLCDGLGVAPDDPRGLTVTGGLPFFGGAGNNYSMHAIAAMARRLRAKPGSFGLISANGGFLSKTSAGVYSTMPAAWRGFDSKHLQAEIDGWPAPVIDQGYAGEAKVETYIIDYAGKTPVGIVIARTPANPRCVAAVRDETLVGRMVLHEPLGATVSIDPAVEGVSLVSGMS